MTETKITEHPDAPKSHNRDEIRKRKAAIRAGELDAPPRDELADHPEFGQAIAEEKAVEAVETAEAEREGIDAKLAAQRARRPKGPEKSDPETVLLGSSVQPSNIKIGDGEVQLGDIVGAAHIRTGLSPEEWNMLTDEKREELIAAEIESARTSAAGVDATEGDEEDLESMLEEAEGE